VICFLRVDSKVDLVTVAVSLFFASFAETEWPGGRMSVARIRGSGRVVKSLTTTHGSTIGCGSLFVEVLRINYTAAGGTGKVRRRFWCELPAIHR
jgi:hypothetical protein